MSSFRVPQPENEPVRSYEPGSPDHAALTAALAALKQSQLEIPLVIGGKAITTGKRIAITAPHNHELVLGRYHQGGVPEIKAAVELMFEVKVDWVQAVNAPGKAKRFGNRAGRRSDFKKAYVRLAAGQTIDFAGSSG